MYKFAVQAIDYIERISRSLSQLATKESTEFPRINFVALLAAALFVTSLFIYWWGVDASSSFGVSESQRWSLWSGPSGNSLTGSSQPSQTLATYSPVLGALVVVSAVLLLVGAIPKANRLLYGSLLPSTLAPVLYAILVAYSVSSSCNGSSFCITGPFGTETRTVGPISITLNWGFQAGFYISVVGVVLALIAVAFHRTFLSVKQ